MIAKLAIATLALAISLAPHINAAAVAASPAPTSQSATQDFIHYFNYRTDSCTGNPYGQDNLYATNTCHPTPSDNSPCKSFQWLVASTKEIHIQIFEQPDCQGEHSVDFLATPDGMNDIACKSVSEESEQRFGTYKSFRAYVPCGKAGDGVHC